MLVTDLRSQCDGMLRFLYVKSPRGLYRHLRQSSFFLQAQRFSFSGLHSVGPLCSHWQIAYGIV